MNLHLVISYSLNIIDLVFKDFKIKGKIKGI